MPIWILYVQAPISYVELDTLPDAYLAFNIEISFKADSPNGLILYNGQGENWMITETYELYILNT